ncbi:ATP-binding protein [Streptomyces sp. NPDC093261]|uniref:ATP-binding protein n=1 Tax=Streptomyces sp. NPDC093261 TaxID=3366037 RepID=UPI00381C7E57
MAPPSLPRSSARLPAGASPDGSAVFDLPAVPAAPGAARSGVRGLLRRWGTGAATGDNAVLVISELVTNAVLHTASERVVCRVSSDGHRLRIEVEDQSLSGTVPTRACPGPDDQGGRGLVLVDALSSGWGVRDAPHGSGRVVWAELPPEPGEVVATAPHL